MSVKLKIKSQLCKLQVPTAYKFIIYDREQFFCLQWYLGTHTHASIWALFPASDPFRLFSLTRTNRKPYLCLRVYALNVATATACTGIRRILWIEKITPNKMGMWKAPIKKKQRFVCEILSIEVRNEYSTDISQFNAERVLLHLPDLYG